MRAALIKSHGVISVEEVKKPLCGGNEIIIRVEACGICGSDLRIFNHGNPRVKFPAILGHEISGIVAEVGKNVGGFDFGDRVAMGADIPCGQCGYCQSGYCNNCETNLAIGYQYPGGFAEFIKINQRVWNGGPFQKIPKNISFEEAALAEPLGCAINGLEILSSSRRGSIAIIGSGVLGSLLVQLAKVFEYKKVFLADIDESKLNMIKKLNLPVDKHLLFNWQFKDKILELTKSRGVDAVVVACASSEAQRLAIEIVAKRGMINLFAGLPQNVSNVSFPANLIHYNEICLTGSHGSTPRQHKMALELISQRKVNVKKLITHKFSLNQIEEAFQTASRNNRLKIIITSNLT